MKSFRVGRLFDIPIELDLTFLLVLPLFAYVIGVQVDRWTEILNDALGANIAVGALTGTPTVAFGIGTLAAVGLFVGVVLHELGHSLMARRYGVEIESIRLWLFGGVAQLASMPEDWKQELYVALAGPVVSVLLGVGAFGAFQFLPADGGTGLAAVKFLVGYLALMNVALAGFNMLPGFPMDGGRVLRALLARDRPYARATQIAARVGQGFALLLGLFGLFGGGGIFLVAIAFFIYIGASSEAQQTTMRAAFEGVVVRDVMTPAEDVHTVDPETSVATLVDRMFRERHTGYPVLRDGRVVGLVTLEDAQSVPQVERDAYLVEDVMSEELVTVTPSTSAMDALSQMQQHGVGRLVVMSDPDPFRPADEATFAGLLSRTDLMTALDIIQSSGTLNRTERRPPTATEGPGGPETESDADARYDGD
jgi:Zn-dependent protease/CBS domain-containing protein